MKISRMCLAAVAAVAIASCGEKKDESAGAKPGAPATKPGPAGKPDDPAAVLGRDKPGAAPDCDGVADKVIALARVDLAALEPAERPAAERALGGARAAVWQACTSNAWSAEVRGCFQRAPDQAAITRCTPDWKQVVDVAAVARAGAPDAESGSADGAASCEEVVAQMVRLADAEIALLPEDEAAAAKRAVGEMTPRLVAKCKSDGWSAKVRDCIRAAPNSASIKSCADPILSP